MLKWIIAAFIIYVIYKRMDFKGIFPGSGSNQKIQEKQKPKDGDYIDYEEIK
jgi:hypothetical protein